MRKKDTTMDSPISIIPLITRNIKNIRVPLPKDQKRIFTITIAILAIEFAVFKYYYPYANYFVDSYQYLGAANSNTDVSMWPIGYAKFLRLSSVFSHSDYALIGFQFFFLKTSELYLYFNLSHLLSFRKTSQWLIWLFILLNPASFYISNYISSDAIFIALSLIWFTQLIGIIHNPNRILLLSNGITLLLLFTLRYNAIYYPTISFIAIFISKQKFQEKLIGITFSTLLISYFIFYTSNEMYKETGTKQFAPFGGWQLANNALYGYEHISSNELKKVPDKFQQLEQMVRNHMDTLQKVKLSNIDSIRSFFYLWSDRGPLIQYMNKQWRNDSTAPYFKKWASEAPLYREYAIWLLKEYPSTFIKHFMLPNFIKYTAPPVEFLGIYNMGSDSVSPLAKLWFRYESQKITHRTKIFEIPLLNQFPIFFGCINAAFLIAILGYLVFKKEMQLNTSENRILATIATLWLINAAFSIFSSPIVLRYQLFIFSILFMTTIYLFEKILTSSKSPVFD